MIKNNFFIGISSIGIMGVPVASVIACSDNKKVIYTYDKVELKDIYKDNYYRPFQFEELKKYGKNQPMMIGGIGQYSYMHGMSFLINIIKKLGLKLDVNVAKESNSKILGINYFNKNNWIKDKKNKNYKDYQKNANDVFKLFDKNQEKWRGVFSSSFISFDPVGVDGGLSSYRFWESGFEGWNNFWTESESGKYIFDSTKVKKKESGKFYPKNKLEYGISSFYNFIDGDNPGKMVLGIVVNNYNPFNFHFGLKFLYRKQNEKIKRWSFNYVMKATEAIYQSFNKISAKKLLEIKLLYKAIIRNMKYQMETDPNNEAVNKIINLVHPTIKRLFNFIKNLDLNDSSILVKIDKAINELNNKSHDLFAVEIFARGVENLPKRYMPYNHFKEISFDLDVSKTKTNLIGIANTSIMANIIKWVSTTKKINGAKVDGESLEPDKMTPYSGLDRWSHGKNQGKIKSYVKFTGKEIPLMHGLVNRLTYQKWWNDNKKLWKDALKNSKKFVPTEKLHYMEK